jgi:hypothetical protein
MLENGGYPSVLDITIFATNYSQHNSVRSLFDSGKYD